MPEYTDNYLVYDQSDAAIYPPKLDTGKVIRSAHLGHNIRDYCNFIIDHYDCLPERTIFVSGNVFPRHVRRDRFDAVVNSASFATFEDRRKMPPRWPVARSKKGKGYEEINNNGYVKNGVTKYFRNYNHFLEFCFVDPVIPKYVRFAPGASYIVPKENILRLPKVFYENLRMFISYSPNAIPSESHIIERAFYTLWTSSDLVVSEPMLNPLDPTFVPPPARPIPLSEKISGFLMSKAEKNIARAKRAIRKILRELYY